MRQEIRRALMEAKLTTPPNQKQRMIRNETFIGKMDAETEEIANIYRHEITFPIND